MTAPAGAPAGTRLDGAGAPLLQLEGLTHRYRARGRKQVHAVEDLTLALEEGEALGLVGESGCGKSTVARCIVGLIRPTGGRILYKGTDMWAMPAKWRRRTLAREVAVVFQDPTSSLNPRLKVRQTLADPLIIHGVRDRAEREARVEELLDMVHLPGDAAGKRPAELSGGQRQRVAIARALSLNPSLLVADEPTSALDVSVQNQILNLLAELRDRLGLAVIFISHNLQAVAWLVDRVAVMYLGRKVETGPVAYVRDRSLHPYTRALLSASPMITQDRERIVLEGSLPDPRRPPSGCPFRTRCWKADDACAAEFPPAFARAAGHEAHCFHPEDRGGGGEPAR